MNIEEAKEILKEMNDFNTFQFCEICKCRIESATDICENKNCEYLKAIETVLNELEKKDKVIDLISDELRYQKGMRQDDIFCYDMCENDEGVVICDRENCKEHIKEYFYKRAGEENDAVGK